MKLLERRAVACAVENWNSTIGTLLCRLVRLVQAAEGRAHGRPCIRGFLQRDLARAGGLQQYPQRRPMRSRVLAVGLEHGCSEVTLQPLRSPRVGSWKFLRALEKWSAPQRCRCRFGHAREKGSRRIECGLKGLPLNVEVGGRVGRGLGAMTGRRCLGLKMGRKQSVQSRRDAGMGAGLLYATETLPRTPHVMERVFRRGPDEHQGVIASSPGVC
jgi:hypothetical protein